MSESRRIPKLRWFYFLPVLFLMGFFTFLSSSLLAIALPGGMMKDLGIAASVAGLASGVTGIGGMILQISGGHSAQKGTLRKFLGITTICWSVITILTAFVTNGWQLIVLRFLLGVAEGASVPGIMTLLTYWFPEKNGERSRAIAVVFSASGIAATLTGPIAGFLIAMFNWKMMFIILGVISLIIGVIWFAVMYDRPEEARWLSKEERDYITTTIQKEQSAFVKDENNNLSGDKLLPILGYLLRNKYSWALSIIGFCGVFGQIGFFTWMPTAIQSVTHAGIGNIGLLSALPSISAILGLAVWSKLTVKIKQRRLSTGIPLLLFAITLASLGLFSNSTNAALYIVLMCIVGFFIQAFMPSFHSIPSLIFSKEVEGAGRGITGVTSAIGGFAGPYLAGIIISITGSQAGAMYVMAMILVVGMLASFILPKNLGLEGQVEKNNVSA
ncbi:MFS transporter [Bacillus sp. S2(2024)]|uniref:MFS transporter n=1 Tax=Bacillus sp. S2(2024) TaxID=3162887 RepID=UPI003D1A373F